MQRRGSGLVWPRRASGPVGRAEGHVHEARGLAAPAGAPGGRRHGPLQRGPPRLRRPGLQWPGLGLRPQQLLPRAEAGRAWQQGRRPSPAARGCCSHGCGPRTHVLQFAQQRPELRAERRGSRVLRVARVLHHARHLGPERRKPAVQRGDVRAEGRSRGRRCKAPSMTTSRAPSLAAASAHGPCKLRAEAANLGPELREL
mmetsp:Transcript_12127/g.37960  ORF Transcript_12127/g.37960 Transcript_12127/m.37960 type:complete len:200 (+) Transcript_12127:504-1103(+)